MPVSGATAGLNENSNAPRRRLARPAGPEEDRKTRVVMKITMRKYAINYTLPMRKRVSFCRAQCDNNRDNNYVLVCATA